MRGLIKGLAFSMAMAAAGFATAAVPQYYVASVNEDQAVLLDLATRNKVGEVVTLDLIILQRRPSTATGSPTYWVDGMQEVDCANHRTRIMLIAAYSLDRSRKASSPNAAFRPWVANNAADTQTIEAFVCRNVRNADIRPVADLTTFQKQYFSGEAGLADRGERAIAEAHAALDKALANPQPVKPPPAPSAPAATAGAAARYLVTSYDRDTAFILDRTQIRRSGAIVSSLNYKLDVKPRRLGSNDIYWSEATKEFDCAQHRIRYIIQANLTLDRRNRIPFQPPMTTEWEAVGKNSDEEQTEALVCTGKVGRSMTASGDDLGALQRAFFSYAAGKDPKFALGPGAAPTPAASSAPGFVVTSFDNASAEIVDRRTIRRNGQIASAATWLYRTNPSPIAGVAYSWAERTMEIDCGKHQHRRMIVGGHTTNFSQHFDMPKPAFDAWDDNDGKMYGDLEALLCNGRAAPEAPVISALTDLIAPFTAYANGSTPRLALATGAAAAGAGPARPAAPPAAARSAPPPSKSPELDLLLVEQNANNATIVNRASTSRRGNVASLAMIVLKRTPRTVDDLKFYWTEADMDFDCAAHRFRVKITYFHTLEMDHPEAVPGAKFDDWEAVKPDMKYMEAFACDGVTRNGSRPIADLPSFGRAFLATGPTAPAPPRTAAPAAVAGHQYYEGDVGKSGATLLDKTSIQRQGDIVTMRNLSIFPEPARDGDAVVHWAESTNQIDCKLHRYRERLDGFLSLDRSQRLPQAKAKFDAWVTVKPKSFARTIEDVVCNRRSARDAEFSIVDDPDEFRTQYLAAIKAGVFKD